MTHMEMLMVLIGCGVGGVALMRLIAWSLRRAERRRWEEANRRAFEIVFGDRMTGGPDQ